MISKEFDFVIYPLKLIITVGLDYDTLCSRFVNKTTNGWGDPSLYDNTGSYVNLVTDNEDDDKYKILWNFDDKDFMTMGVICHESLHVATTVCSHCSMSFRLEQGQDEHPAYIAGFAGDCVSKMFSLLEDQSNEQEKTIG